ncbi:MAG: hypothetical protein S4CHLAM20_14300 [Chlamydiia bacterium]|nr:hypothetical protein [Chlamydiia bacterium]
MLFIRKNFRLFLSLLFLLSFQSLHAEKVKTSPQRIYLATYPRSGNHWVRWLIEEATLIATGSVYTISEPIGKRYTKDKTLLKGNPWVDWQNPSFNNHFSLLKTHYPFLKYPMPRNFAHCDLVIRLIRNPIDSLSSHAKREKIPKKKLSNGYIKDHLRAWSDFHTYWDKQPNVLTIRYEDLLIEPEKNLELILNALEFKYSQSDIKRAVAAFPPRGKHLKHLDNYTMRNLAFIQERLIHRLEKYNYSF